MNNTPGTIPANYMQLLAAEGNVDNREAIINYIVSPPGTFELTAFQKELKERWEYADDQMRSRRFSRKEVAVLLTKKFDYNISTAWKDIAAAEYIFGSTTQPNKRYLLAIHVDRIEEACRLAQRQGDTKIIPLLYRELTRAILALPEEQAANNAPAATIFSFTRKDMEQLSNTPMTFAEAQEVAKERLKELGITDIEFEDVTDGKL